MHELQEHVDLRKERRQVPSRGQGVKIKSYEERKGRPMNQVFIVVVEDGQFKEDQLRSQIERLPYVKSTHSLEGVLQDMAMNLTDLIEAAAIKPR